MGKTPSQTYLQYLYGTNTLEDVETLPVQGYLDNTFRFDKQYFVLTGIVKEGYFSSVGNLLDWIPVVGGETPGRSYPPIILEKTASNYDAVGCDKFLTKA